MWLLLFLFSLTHRERVVLQILELRPRTDLRWVGAAPGKCDFAANATSSELSLRGNRPAGCTSGQTTEEGEEMSSLENTWTLKLRQRPHSWVFWLFCRFNVHLLRPRPGVCVRLPCERVCVERCKHTGRHAALTQHTQSSASLASELDDKNRNIHVFNYILPSWHHTL